MARVTQSANVVTVPRWAGDYLDPVHLVPGGVKLVAAAFTDYLDETSNLTTIPSGTPIGRTTAERDAGTGYGPAAAVDDEIFLLAFDVVDVATNNDGVLYRPGSVVKENFLPAVGDIVSGVLDEIRLRYICVKGAQ